MLLAVLLVLAPLTGCLEAGGPTPPTDGEGALEDGDQAPDTPEPDPPETGSGGPGTDETGRSQDTAFLTVAAGSREYHAFPGELVFEALKEPLWELFENASQANGTPFPIDGLGPEEDSLRTVLLVANESYAERVPLPAGPDGSAAHIGAVMLVSANASLQGKVIACGLQETCQAYDTTADTEPLAHLADLFGPEVIEYTVNGSAARDHFRDHGWVNVTVPIAGTLTINGTEKSLFSEDACVTERGPNNTTEETCGEELAQQSAFLDGHVASAPPGRNNSATLTLAETGIYGLIEWEGQRYQLSPVHQPDGTFRQQATAEPGLPDTRVLVRLADDQPPAHLTVRLDGIEVLDGTVQPTGPGLPGASTPFLEWPTFRVNLTIERDGSMLGDPVELPLPPVSYLHIVVEAETYQAQTASSPTLQP